MRLDKFLSVCAVASRSESKRAVRAGAVTVNGVAAKSSDMTVDPEGDEIFFRGERVSYSKYTYILLNKPDGFVSATDARGEKTVLDLLPEKFTKMGLFPCGRLDKNTLGLVLMTDDGELAHRLLSPKNHVEKKYLFRSKFPLDAGDVSRFESGLELEDGYLTKPAKIDLNDEGDGGVITLCEGKYHQIKRMLEALDNKIIYLERISFACLTLDNDALGRGEWRYLDVSEIEELRKIAGLDESSDV